MRLHTLLRFKASNKSQITSTKRSRLYESTIAATNKRYSRIFYLM